MKSKFLLVMMSIVAFSNITLKSQTITSDGAKTVAVNFYNQQVTAERSVKPSEISKADISLMKAEEIDLYYVININEDGFVIVSAHQNIYPVLAFSTKNSFSNTKIPVNVTALLSTLKNQIIHAVQNNLEADSKIKTAWNQILNNELPKFTETGVEPLLTSTWAQGVPYNLFCPEDPAGPGGHVVTGCPSTAMAQLMFYYRYPESGVGSNSYTQNPYGTISADFENAYYDYNAMTNVSNNSNYEEVAELTFHAGVAINTFYGPTVSGIFDMQVLVDGLEDHFNYSEDAELIFKTSYTQTEWENLIKNDLDMLMPVIYCAVDMIAEGGHTWVLDGYADESYFHMNFGWGGSFDGYYYLDNISVAGYTFDEMHQMVINVFPADPNYPGFCNEPTDLTNFDGTFTDGSGPYNYENNANCSWLINPQTEFDSVSSITLSFDKFDTEPVNDFVSVFDVLPDGSLGLIATISGNEIPGSYTSTGNRMLVTFTTNETETDTGFVASYYSNMPVYCNGVEYYSEEYGTVSDGSGSFNYHSNSTCMWSIEPEMASSVTAHFNYFETEEDDDVLSIYDNIELIGTFSGTGIPSDITAESGKMFITFQTNGTNNFNGWEIEYTSTITGTEEGDSDNSIWNVFPNPANDLITIKFGQVIKENATTIITNAYGQLMLEHILEPSVGSSEFEIDCSSFSPGLYMVTMKDDTQILTKKIVVQ